VFTRGLNGAGEMPVGAAARPDSFHLSKQDPHETGPTLSPSLHRQCFGYKKKHTSSAKNLRFFWTRHEDSCSVHLSLKPRVGAYLNRAETGDWLGIRGIGEVQYFSFFVMKIGVRFW